MMENMEAMNEDTFMAYFSDERTWSTVLSNGEIVPLKNNGENETVHYEERIEYAQKVQEVRMKEADKQVRNEQ